MPLLQFLAYYQVIEFYYPRYSRSAARQRLSAILKDPTFRPERDEHVDRLIASVFVTRGGSIGDERSQLRAVINECLSEDDARDFFTADIGRESHFSEKTSKQNIIKFLL
jgi:hypothetical protein